MTAPLPARRPDALDLAETLAIAASDIRAVASFVSVTGDVADEISDAREAANRVLAALDAYEARTMTAPTNTAADIPDQELLRRAVRNARPKRQRASLTSPRWVAVVDTFALGSTYATQLCRRFSLDPDEKVRS